MDTVEATGTCSMHQGCVRGVGDILEAMGTYLRRQKRVGGISDAFQVSVTRFGDEGALETLRVHWRRW